MKKYFSRALPVRAVAVMSGLALAVGLSFGTAHATGQIDVDALKVVKAMTTHLNALPAFSVNMDLGDEVLDTTGRKLQLSASTSLVVKRPAAIYAHRQGPVADMEMFSDGKQLTVHGKGLNIYIQKDTSGGIDGAIDQVRAETGLEAPAGDLLYSDAYEGLMDGVVSADYVGTGFVNGVECHHLAFRQDQVDWQLWVQKGDEPLPMKYVITSKWVTGAPQHSVRFRDWNSRPEIGVDRFTFSAPSGAKQIQEISLDEIGRVVLGGER